MKTAIFIGLVILNVISASAQHYDLLVKTDGDSIACRIDSITASNYFFKMKYNGYWVHTNIDKKDVIKYEAGVVDKKTTQFIPGTTIIEQQISKDTDNYLKGSIFLEFGGKGYASANYGFRLNQHHRISLGLGIADYDATLYPALGFMYYYLMGKKKSFFELGIGMSYALGSGNEASGIPLIYYGVIGYRYQKSEGMLFRAGLTPISDLESYYVPLIGLSIGYSF